MSAAHEVRHEGVLFFYGRAHPFSNHHRAHYTVRGVTFNCGEQGLMYCKARLFNDMDTAQKILEADDPISHKRLGRQVRGFQDAVWRARAPGFARTLANHRFSQNPDQLRYLLDTHPYRLVEASPSDQIWGIGLGLGDPRIYDQRYWRGDNLWGTVLEMSRDDLSASSLS